MVELFQEQRLGSCIGTALKDKDRTRHMADSMNGNMCSLKMSTDGALW